MGSASMGRGIARRTRSDATQPSVADIQLTGDTSLRAMEVLGYTRLSDPSQIYEHIEKGLDTNRVGRFAKRYCVADAMVEVLLGISHSTLIRRRRAGRLASAESDRLVRISGLYKFAEDVLGSPESAAEWMRSTNRGLGGRSPVEFAKNEAGAREVEQLIGRIAHGVFS